MDYDTYNILMEAGSDEPPVDFVPKNVIIDGEIHKQIWLDNHKRIQSEFFKYVHNTKFHGNKLELPMYDGCTYYAIIDKEGLPIFYRKEWKLTNE